MTVTRAPAELWTAAISAAADRHTMERLGIPSPLLMERAALCVSQEVAALRAGTGLPVLVLCGPGNNGGDGLAVARQLFGWEIPAQAVLCTDTHNDAVAQQLALCRSFGVTVHEGWPALTGTALVVDGLLGTGSRGAPRGAIGEALARQASIEGPRVAIDLPTGIDADTGEVFDGAFAADVTVTFVRSKPGLHVTPGRGHAGRVVVGDIGLLGEPDRDRTHALVDPGFVGRVLSRLPAGAHKGQRGHLGVVGGSAGTPGAAVLAAAGALRSGTGLVTIASRDPVVAEQIVAHRPEVMVIARDDAALLPRADALCVGPGLTDPADRVGLEALWRDESRPMVVDASGLDEVPLGANGKPCQAGPRVITPHPGEAARLLARAEPDGDWDGGKVVAQRIAAARALAWHTGAVAVLKGEGTIVADPLGNGVRPEAPEQIVVSIVVTGGPGLATAGSGDVLAGLVGGLLARGLPGAAAACVGAYVHGLAGERMHVDGAVAMDVADALGDAMAFVRSREGRGHARWPGLRRG